MALEYFFVLVVVVRRCRWAIQLVRFWLSWCAIGVHAIVAATYGLVDRPASQPYLNGKLPQANPQPHPAWSCVPIFPELKFTNALGLTFVPGTAELAVWEREGRIYSFSNTPSVARKKLILDVHDRCQGWDDSGLLGVAFHPGFATNHSVFVYYTWVAPGTVVGNPSNRPPEFKKGAYHDRLSKFVTDESGSALAGPEIVLVDQVGDSAWHNGGGLFFHPRDGFLYYTDGDDRRAPTQVIDQDLFSGVFRLDVDQRGGTVSHPIFHQPKHGKTANYFIPNDNPFVGQPGVLEEFYALGLRNPHRMTIDPVSERIFIGDVGMDQREEIDVIEPTDRSGVNFQWNLAEGRGAKLGTPRRGADRGPLLDYDHGDGQAVIGGHVYRGKRLAAQLAGKYIFGDNVQRKIWVLDESTKPARKTLLCVLPEGQGPSSGSSYTGLSSFGLDADGELYLCQMSSQGGGIFQLEPNRATDAVTPLPEFPRLLSQTGAFDDTARLRPASALLPYEVISPLWSDGAAKRRWMALPLGKQIAVTNGNWTFPEGTVFIKHFEMPVTGLPGSQPRRLETRFLITGPKRVVFGATYRWRQDQSDADLLEDMVDEEVSIPGDQGSLQRAWHYPSRTECALCHNVDAGGILGVKATQLNRDFTYPSTGNTDNQLRTWNHLGLFAPALDENGIPKMAKLVSPDDRTASLEARARSYLDANCSHCHHSNSGAWDARMATALDQANIVNGPVSLDLGLESGKVVVPGHPERSVMLYRLKNTGVTKMPPVSKNYPDDAAVELFSQWINSMAAGPVP